MPQFRRDGKGLINSTGSLWEILKTAGNDPQAGPVIIVLDALDECAESEFSDLVRNVEKQFHNNKLGHGKVKYLLTSRPYEQIVSKFSGLLGDFPKIRIPGEEGSEFISQEVNRVITYRVNQLSKRKGLSAELQNHLERRLRQTTHRTYLWVYLVFDYLEQENFKKTLKGIESTVVTLPKSVNEAYEQILSKSKEDPMVRKVLSIILAASRPLTLSEMNIAVNVDFNSQSIRDLDLEDEEDFKSRLRAWCGLFVSIHHGKIYFLHQTAREFLLADLPLPTATPLDLRWHRSITACQAHAVLLEPCVLFLNLLNTGSSVAEEETACFSGGHSFLDYSARNWSVHFRESGIIDDGAIMPFVLKICNPESKSFLAWFKGYWKSMRVRVIAHGRVITTRDNPKHLTDLMVASYFGYHGVVKLLLERGAKIDQKGENDWTALSNAAEGGHCDVVKLLLGAGATVDCEYDISYTVRHGINRGSLYSDERGHISRSRQNSGRPFGLICKRTPLSRAAEKGHEAVTRVLIETGKADIDWMDEMTWTPLSWAIEGRHGNIVKLLLGSGAKVHYKYNIPSEVNGKYRVTTPLSRAAETGRGDVVKLLLETSKVDVDWRDEKGWTPLSWAVETGFQGVVKLLLKAGATVQFEYNVYEQKFARDDRHARATYRDQIYLRTPLSRAAEMGDEAVVGLLLDTGKNDLNYKEEKGWTPLSWAVEGNHWATARKLVRAGANIYHEYEIVEYDMSGYPACGVCTPLSRANEKGQENANDLVLEARRHNRHVMASRTLNVSQKAGSTPPETCTGIPSTNRKRRRS